MINEMKINKNEKIKFIIQIYIFIEKFKKNSK